MNTTTPARFVRIAERDPREIPARDSDARILSQIEHHMTPRDRVNPTRSQWGAACRKAYPRAGIFVGGHHVAVHLRGDDSRSLLFTGSGQDWR